MATFILRIFPRALTMLLASLDDLHGAEHLEVEATVHGVKRIVPSKAIPSFPTNSV
jgi:predicted RNA polymerase sigma factor